MVLMQGNTEFSVIQLLVHPTIVLSKEESHMFLMNRMCILCDMLDYINCTICYDNSLRLQFQVFPTGVDQEK